MNKLTASLKTHLEDLISNTEADIKTYENKIAAAKRDVETFTGYKNEALETIECLKGMLTNAEKKNVKRNLPKA